MTSPGQKGERDMKKYRIASFVVLVVLLLVPGIRIFAQPAAAEKQAHPANYVKQLESRLAELSTALEHSQARESELEARVWARWPGFLVALLGIASFVLGALLIMLAGHFWSQRIHLRLRELERLRVESENAAIVSKRRISNLLIEMCSYSGSDYGIWFQAPVGDRYNRVEESGPMVSWYECRSCQERVREDRLLTHASRHRQDQAHTAHLMEVLPSPPSGREAAAPLLNLDSPGCPRCGAQMGSNLLGQVCGCGYSQA